MRVWLLQSGTISLEQTQITWNVAGPAQELPVYSVLVKHDDGLFLFDTGMNVDHMIEKMPARMAKQREDQTIPAQLEQCGFSLEDVTATGNSHLHVDHVGGNRHFAGLGTRHLIHERELRQARGAHEIFEAPGYSDRSWDYDGAVIESFSGDYVVAPGIWLIETPGHTVGHCSLLLLGANSMLFLGDVSYTSKAFADNLQPGFHNDPRAGVVAIDRVRDIATRHGARLMFSHDMESWREYRQVPDFYAL